MLPWQESPQSEMQAVRRKFLRPGTAGYVDKTVGCPSFAGNPFGRETKFGYRSRGTFLWFGQPKLQGLCRWPKHSFSASWRLFDKSQWDERFHLPSVCGCVCVALSPQRLLQFAGTSTSQWLHLSAALVTLSVSIA